MKQVLEMGELRMIFEAPGELAEIADVRVSVHPRNAAEFERVVELLGGLAAFNDYREGRLTAPRTGDGSDDLLLGDGVKLSLFARLGQTSLSPLTAAERELVERQRRQVELVGQIPEGGCYPTGGAER